jgi:nucleoside-diphosphate-sugar epimerase
MKIVVTGARGFLGSHFLRDVTEGSDEVIGVVRPGGAAAGRGNVFVEADLSQRGWSAALPEAADIVLHLSQSARYHEFPGGAADMVAVNIDATGELLEWSRTHRVRRFVLASTGNVYRASSGEVREDAPCEPGSMYAASKLSAEHLARQYANYFDCVILRIFGLYGPGQSKGFIRGVVQRIQRGEELTLAEGVGIRTNPLYVGDACRALRAICRAEPRSGTTTYNLGGDRAYALPEIAEIAGAALGKQAVLRVVADRPATTLLGNTEAFAAAFSWSPRVSLSEGLGLTVGGTGS